VEDANDIVRAAHGDHRQPGEIRDRMIARVAQLAHVRDELPAAIEDQRAIHRDERGVGVEARGQGGRVFQRLRREVGRRRRNRGKGLRFVHGAEYEPGAARARGRVTGLPPRIR
jgi:hypothetical protein